MYKIQGTQQDKVLALHELRRPWVLPEPNPAGRQHTGRRNSTPMASRVREQGCTIPARDRKAESDSIN